MTGSTPAPRLASSHDADWWRQAAVYQIYPRSFADGDGDGIGDLRGIISRVPYLSLLGIDAVWLSPFYPSPLADGGYDVADYRDVDPKIGTLADFDELVDLLHANGIRVIVDIVPNHSSEQHAWFQSALASPAGSAERDRYIFRNGLGSAGEKPPADWAAAFGGAAWEPVGDGQWYLHTFAKEQPDFNWDNNEVREDFRRTLRFWSDRGVDGFRVDVANLLVKELSDDLPTQVQLDALDRDGGNHPLTDRDEVHDVYADWRAVFNEYDPPRTAVAEAWVDAPHRRARYASPSGLGQAFNFDLLRADFDARQFHRIVTENLEHAAIAGSSSTWVLSNHDVTRHATRYGLPSLDGRDVKQGVEWLAEGGDHRQIDALGGVRRASAAIMFLLALPGSTYLYQGEELGLHEVGDIPADRRQDPAFFRGGGNNYDGIGRDGCRVPLPWTRSGESFGFGPAHAHLPQPEWFGAVSVEAQESDPTSMLRLYRNALKLRRELQTREGLEWLDETSRDDVLAFIRPNGWVNVTNFGATPTALPQGNVLLASTPLDETELPPFATAWLQR